MFINLLKITVDFFSFFSQPSKKACFFFGHLGCVFSLRPGCHYEIPRCQNELLPPEQEWMAWNMCSTLSLNPKLMVLLRWCSFFFIYLTTDIHLIVHDLSVICPSTPKTTVLFKKPKKKHNVWKLAKNLYSTKNWAGQHFNANKLLEITQPLSLKSNVWDF